MRKEIVLVLVAAVLLLGGMAAAFESVDVSSWKIPSFDPGGPQDRRYNFFFLFFFF